MDRGCFEFGVGSVYRWGDLWEGQRLRVGNSGKCGGCEGNNGTASRHGGNPLAGGETVFAAIVPVNAKVR
ncbi:hypothetical protein Cmtc_37260 [Cupriavidus sp. TKC]|nr:hypothetical protein Cmtc_37260 [Cupriavidus sp. TKC]